MSVTTYPTAEHLRAPRAAASRVHWWSGIAPGSLHGRPTEAAVDTCPAVTPAPARGTPRSASCAHDLGGLPCVNDRPHPGRGRGCVHHSGSGYASDE